jgi:DNA-binding beta-propeller fold protein YncE
LIVRLALATFGLVALTATPVLAAPPVKAFEPIASYQVDGEVAEIVAATVDGRTLIHTDASLGRIGFVDLTDPAAPAPDGTLDVDGSPTAVATTPDGRWALVTVDQTDGASTDPAGALQVVNLATRAIAETIDLGGQPDSIAVSADGRYAAIAIENQRDEDFEPTDGGLPQLPAGHLTIVDLVGDPDAWGLRVVDLVGLPGLTEPTDPEPEFVDISASNVVALTLQENNAIALIDLVSGDVLDSWSAGSATHAADLTDDDVIDLGESLTAVREPDAIGWTPRGNLMTANEGDWLGGTRDATIFRAEGSIAWDSGASLELAAVDAGYYDDGRSDNKGIEPEGLEIGDYGNRVFAFVAAERAGFVAVYRLLGNETSPRLIQLLPTGDRPEGLLAIPSRGLFVSANEGDGTIDVFAARRPGP